jgi:Protein phosphatase 2C
VIVPQIIDSISIAGDRTKVNDDTFGAAGNRVWVLDGATGLGGTFLPGHSDAAWLARNANRLLHTHHAIRDSDQLVKVVIEGLASAFEVECLRNPQERWELPVASLLMFTVGGNEIEAVWLGDCRAIIDIGGKVLSCGETPAGEAEERAFAANLGGKLGATAMLRSPSVINELRIARNTCNTGKAGRWLVGLEPKAAEHLERMVFPLDGPVKGLAMSDGFSALELKYKRYTTEALISCAKSRGLATLAGELRHIEEIEDPDGAAFPRFKRSDDATAVLFCAG